MPEARLASACSGVIVLVLRSGSRGNNGALPVDSARRHGEGGDHPHSFADLEPGDALSDGVHDPGSFETDVRREGRFSEGPPPRNSCRPPERRLNPFDSTCQSGRSPGSGWRPGPGRGAPSDPRGAPTPPRGGHVLWPTPPTRELWTPPACRRTCPSRRRMRAGVGTRSATRRDPYRRRSSRGRTA